MKKMIGTLVVFAIVANAFGVSKTSTGFYYPTGTSNLGNLPGWLASGCNGSNGYYSNEYHLGKDIKANLNDLVYAITNGEIVAIGPGGWGDGNVGVFIKHRLLNGEYFLALYGHVKTNKNIGDQVYAGQSFATVGYWKDGVHLHFGITPNSYYPMTNWGRIPCSEWPSTNGFVDPINWIKTKTPFMVGMFSDGWHSDISPKFVMAHEFYGGAEVIGVPYNAGRGIYVYDRYGVKIQSFKKPNNSHIYYLVYNKFQYHIFLVHGSIASYLFNNLIASGYLPISDEATYLYGGHDTDFIKRGIDCVMQKFGKRTNTDYPQKTIVWNAKTGKTQNFPCGEFSANVINGGWCAEFISSSTIVKMPCNGATDGFHLWLCSAGDYIFHIYNSFGQAVDALAHHVFEGNAQHWEPNYSDQNPPSPEPLPPSPEPPPAIGDKPVLKVSTVVLDFGSTETEKTFKIENSGSGTLNWSMTTDPYCISCSPNYGSGNATIIVKLDRTNVREGSHEGKIFITSNGGSQNIVVKFVKESTPQPPSNSNMLVPGNWQFELHANNQAQMSNDNGTIYVKILSLASDYSNNPYRVQVFQKVSFNANSSYQISFQSKGTIPWMVYEIGKAESDWKSYLHNTAELTSSWKPFSCNFTAPADIIQNTKFDFQFGSGIGEVWVKDITLIKISLSKEMSEATVISLPTEFELFQNYPNPFNPITTISFALPKEQLVTLKVFDALGKEVICLVDGNQKAGLHYSAFDASQLPTGIYFYTLQSRDFTKTRKMALIK